MIRLTWLQSRTQTLVTFGLLVVLAIVLAITGSHLVHLYDTTVAHCAAQGDCQVAQSNLLSDDALLRNGLNALALVVPALIGIFWGAPLIAREIETGTFRLAWTQSITRERWLVVKLGVVGLSTMAVAGLFSLMVSWWSSPMDKVNANQFSSFSQRDIVPIGYAAFAFALGVTAGLLIRRTVPAMAATLAVFVAARVAVTQWVRPNLIAPAHLDLALKANSFGIQIVNGGAATLMPNQPNIPNAWIYSVKIVDKAGHALPSRLLATACPDIGVGPPGSPSISQHAIRLQVPPGAQNALRSCVTKLSATFHEVVAYQPANRFWTFQWYELAIFLGASLVLAGVCWWGVRRRLS